MDPEVPQHVSDGEDVSRDADRIPVDGNTRQLRGIGTRPEGAERQSRGREAVPTGGGETRHAHHERDRSPHLALRDYRVSRPGPQGADDRVDRSSMERSGIPPIGTSAPFRSVNADADARGSGYRFGDAIIFSTADKEQNPPEPTQSASRGHDGACCTADCPWRSELGALRSSHRALRKRFDERIGPNTPNKPDRIDRVFTELQGIKAYVLALEIKLDEYASANARDKDDLEVHARGFRADRELLQQRIDELERPSLTPSLEEQVHERAHHRREQTREGLDRPTQQLAFATPSHNRAFPGGVIPIAQPEPKTGHRGPMTPGAAIRLQRGEGDPRYDPYMDPLAKGKLSLWDFPDKEAVEAFQGAQFPGGFKPKLPEPRDFEKFGGRKENPANVLARLQDWINNSSLIVESREMPYKVFMSYMPQLLQNDALEWYKGEIRKDWSPTGYLWPIFTQGILNRYTSRNTTLHEERALLKWRFPDPKYPEAGDWFNGFSNACRNVYTDGLSVSHFLSLLNGAIDIYLMGEIHRANQAPNEFQSIDDIGPVFEEIMEHHGDRLRFDGEASKGARSRATTREEKGGRERRSGTDRNRVPGPIRSNREGRFARRDDPAQTAAAVATPAMAPVKRYSNTAKDNPVTRFDVKAGEKALERVRRCYACGEQGHIRSQCTNPPIHEQRYGRVGAIEHVCHIAAVGLVGAIASKPVAKQPAPVKNNASFGADGKLQIGAIAAEHGDFSESEYTDRETSEDDPILSDYEDA